MTDDVPASPPSAAARERAVEVLSQHYVSDDLTEDELEARFQRVYEATTVAQLDAVLADLPTPASLPAQAAAGPAIRPMKVSATMSGQERRMVGRMPRELRVVSRVGYVEIDLTEAMFEPGETTIRINAFMGYVQIRLPPGVRVESEGHAILGYFAARGPRADRMAQPDHGDGGPGSGGGVPAPVVRVTGRAIFGYAECFSTGSGRDG